MEAQQRRPAYQVRDARRDVLHFMNYVMSRLWAAHVAVERSNASNAMHRQLRSAAAAIRVLQVARKRHGAATGRLRPH